MLQAEGTLTSDLPITTVPAQQPMGDEYCST